VLLSVLNSTIKNTKVYYYIIAYGLVASMYETLITGINEFHTILFWFSLAFLSFSKFQLSHED